MTNPPQQSADGALHASALGASLTVGNLAHSVAWYRDVLGFTVAREYAPRGPVVAVALRAGTIEILLTQDNGAQGADRVKGQGLSLQFTVGESGADIDALAARVAARGGTLADPPMDVAGARAFRLRDPDGFKLVFSSPRTR